MAYLRDAQGLAGPGCGGNCGCASCRRRSGTLGEYYYEGEGRDEPPRARATRGASAKENAMYMYDQLGEPPAKPVDPAGHQKEVCPLIRGQMGKFLDFQDYLTRALDSKDPLSQFKVMRNRDLYDAFVDSCKKDVIEEILKAIPWFPRIFRPPPRDPKNPTDLRMR